MYFKDYLNFRAGDPHHLPAGKPDAVLERPGATSPLPARHPARDSAHLVSKRLIVTGAQLTKVVETDGYRLRRSKQRHRVGVAPAEAPQRQV